VSRIKVLHVVDAGDAHAAAHAAALRDHLDPARFDASVAVAASLRQLRRLFSEQRPDVVHAHSPKAGLRARAAAKAAGVKKFIYTPHGFPAKRALLRVLERALAPSRPHPALRDPYLGAFPEPLPHDDIVVGSRGRMTPARNPDAWVLLVQRLTDSRNGVKCVWLGGGEGEAKARTDLTNMNLLMKVTVTGRLTDAESLEKMRGLDIFVRYSRAEASPEALLEAMALGLPVVAADLPAHRDAVVNGDTGFLVNSEVELLERCQQLIDDAPLRRRLGAAARERVRTEFSRERQLAELSRLYAA